MVSSESLGRINSAVLMNYNKDVTRLPLLARPENMDVATYTVSKLCHIVTFLAGRTKDAYGCESEDRICVSNSIGDNVGWKPIAMIKLCTRRCAHNTKSHI